MYISFKNYVHFIFAIINIHLSVFFVSVSTNLKKMLIFKRLINNILSFSELRIHESAQ